MKYSCIVVDDEQTARSILKKYIGEIASLELLGDYRNALEALTFIDKNPVDIIFLDIEMPKLSGINLAKIIDRKSHVIFTTAHREFAVEGFELNAVDYLLKPFSFDRFLQAVQRIITADKSKDSESETDYIFLKIGRQMVKVNFSDLLFIEGLSNYVKVHTSKKTLVCYYKLTELTELLPDRFVRVHKSYIVNLDKISIYTREHVQIEKKHIPISATYRNTLLSRLK